jgi:hypothetical protein
MIKQKGIVYLPVKIEDELPKEKGHYGVKSRNLSTGLELIDDLQFDGEKFLEVPNCQILFWLKPVEGFFFTEEEMENFLKQIQFK